MTCISPLLVTPEIHSYRRLLGEQAWSKLHPAIRQRFENIPSSKVTYHGTMDEVYLSWAGLIFAHLCRLIGTPLALYNGKNIPVKVNVYQNSNPEGMTWDRYYSFPKKPVNRVKSTKCITPQGGLVEVVGCGFGMQLKTYENADALVFESVQFYCKFGGFKFVIPDIITPGKTVVSHRALDDNRFEFKLTVIHPIMGIVFHQSGIFQ